MIKFHATPIVMRTSLYKSDGSGRDSYIISNNGGQCKEIKESN